jgi:hypothetical protein
MIKVINWNMCELLITYPLVQLNASFTNVDKVKVHLILQLFMKAQKGSRCVAQLCL